MGSHSKRAHARKRSATRRRTMAATATVAVTLPVVGFLAQPATAADDPVDCAQGRVFVVPGTADPNSLHTAGLETRYGTQGKDYRIEVVEYPGVLWPLGATSYDQSVDEGIANLETAVAAYHAACPERPVVIVGYSQGARIAGDVLSEIGRGQSSVDIDPAQVSGELYSDPRRTGDAQGRGIELILPGVLPGITMSGPREGFGQVRVTQFCVEGDPICDLQDPLHYPLRAVDGLLGYFVKHVTYDDDITTGPDVSENSPSDVLIPSDPAFGVILRSLGLPYHHIAVENPLQYPDLAVLRPLFHAVDQFLPALPNLGHGAYLPDLWVLRDALSGSPTALQAIGDSAISILRYPENFVRDWIAEIDRQLDRLDGARLGVAPKSGPTTPAPAAQRTVEAPREDQVWIEPQDLPPAVAPGPASVSTPPHATEPVASGPAVAEPAAAEPTDESAAPERSPVSTPAPSPEPVRSATPSGDVASVDGSGAGAVDKELEPAAAS
ncbi:PE-PPE domain-containing protein [Williamsia sp. 1135]|uniref:cutinase family protein n=1 Tax=Williamsia sp. 1135 TaxID=1889262 RepID=UPI000A103CE5|nr:PE-PPE domain-containing protein [Williamsia sp. 1135]ORM25921.1 hypothetical protein BFL43_23615 [Williamsia sp. 1135]